MHCWSRHVAAQRGVPGAGRAGSAVKEDSTMTSATPDHGAGSPGASQAPPSGGGAQGWDRAQDMAGRAGTEAGAKLGEARTRAAQGVDTLAESALAAAEKLRGSELGPLSGYVDQLAESMRRLSGGLRERSGDELVQEIGRLARENPGLFVTGGVALGFGLTRFAKAASPSRRASTSSAGTSSNATATSSTSSYDSTSSVSTSDASTRDSLGSDTLGSDTLGSDAIAMQMPSGQPMQRGEIRP
jgi:hypothetical protein